MADDNNHILDKIDGALRDPETPRWAVPMLLCQRDDHCKLVDHLAAHDVWSAPARQVLVSVLTAVTITLAVWLLAGRLPAIFGP